MPPEKAAEGAAVQDTVRGKMTLEIREAFWSAPVLWRFASGQNICQIFA